MRRASGICPLAGRRVAFIFYGLSHKEQRRDGINLPQFLSSELSPQSLLRLHLQLAGIRLLLSHVNCAGRGGSIGPRIYFKTNLIKVFTMTVIYLTPVVLSASFIKLQVSGYYLYFKN